MDSWPLRLALTAGLCSMATAAFAQPRIEDHSETITITAGGGCAPYTWPIVTTPHASTATQWHDLAIKDVCQTVGVPVGGLRLEVRGDGRIVAKNGTALANERFVGELYQKTAFVSRAVRLTIDASGRHAITPQGIEARLPNVKLALPELELGIRYYARQLTLPAGAVVVDVTVNPDNTVSWAGMADPNRDADRTAAFANCLPQLWDLPFERHLICGARIALLAVTPR
jgi:hypothetical protein